MGKKPGLLFCTHLACNGGSALAVLDKSAQAGGSVDGQPHDGGVRGQQ